MSSAGRKCTVVPFVAGLIIEGCLIAMWVLGNLRLQVPVFFALFGLASVAYLVAIWQSRHMSVMSIFVFAIVFRFTLLFVAPTLSDDIYRYVWDGRVLWSGINPYAFAPMDDALVSLRDAQIFAKINHAELPTIYPPMAQIAFWVGYGISESVWGIKLVLVGADMLSCWLLFCLLRHFKMRTQWAVIYCWHPLVLLEIAGSGHIEGLGICAVLSALFLFSKGKDRLALGILGGGVLVKFLPLIFLPGFIRWNRWVPENWKEFLVLPCVVVAGYLPFAWTGESVFGSLSVYAEHWSFNSPVYDLLYWILGDGRVVRGIIGVVFGIVILGLIWLRVIPWVFFFWVVVAFVLLTPTLHPWYVIWLVPFLVFYRNLAWIVFSLLVVLSYHVLIRYEARGVWEEVLWVQFVEFGGLLGLTIFGWCMKDRLSCWFDLANLQPNLDENRSIS